MPRTSIMIARGRASIRSLALPLFFAIAVVAASAIALSPQPTSRSASSVPQPALKSPDASCATCHEAIVERYRQTPMAHASGQAADGFVPGDFTDALSGVHYRIFLRDGATWMSFSRSLSADGRDPLSGEEQLLYFIGSGHRGRTFLYERDGLWFELPVNLYAHHGWDITPKQQHNPNMPDALPIDSGCLHCHTTTVAPVRANARNSFPQPPFAQGGIGCSACHGDPSAHLAAQGHGPILNPAKLTPAKRDSVCLQCHLEGNVIIDRPGHSLAAFTPGDDLNESEAYFVLAAQATGGARATSQWEALAASACKRAAGDRMTCTTCHDPHGDPQSPDARIEYFRARCLTCHTSPQLATQHHPEERNCATCHMPRSPTSDVAHDQVTDHDIQRHPHHASPANDGAPIELVPVSGFTASGRELGLAYAQWAGTQNDQAAGERALTLLQRAEKAGADDESVHENLGFLDQLSGNLTAAEREYREALAKDPYSPVASTNLAILDLRSGRSAEAAQLLDRLVTANPAQTRAGLILATIECLSGHADQARALTLKLQTFARDSPALRNFLQHGTYSGISCPAMVSAR